MQVDDKDVINAMLNGGLRLCDDAITKWQSGEYTRGLPASEQRNLIQANYQKYREMKERMKQIAKEIRA